ncbi:helix-turn-helix domain-containing protein [Sinomonas humi]|uniref:Helix-turn-helix domain-containing protein n=1 Tax=Sinomonas humi TaxID=1338436 RepID=A0A0B2AID8_9MICC|nr:helix-turn-helix domain-containing protein [Sinomonas humi]KHL01601.1 hypothetical protein LK10_15245 [Sinomonas humi]
MAQTAAAAPSALLPSAEQAEVIDFIESLRARGGTPAEPSARIVSADGTRGVVIPESMFQILVDVAEALKAGLAVTVAPRHLALSTQEAADLLQISRTTLVRLLESGAIPFDKPSRHRRVRLEDVLEYMKRQRAAAAQALDDMVADAERLGMYDVAGEEIADALKHARRAR